MRTFFADFLYAWRIARCVRAARRLGFSAGHARILVDRIGPALLAQAFDYLDLRREQTAVFAMNRLPAERAVGFILGYRQAVGEMKTILRAGDSTTPVATPAANAGTEPAGEPALEDPLPY